MLCVRSKALLYDDAEAFYRSFEPSFGVKPDGYT